MEYKNYNANPKQRKTGDCVIRAISVAFDQSWEDTYTDLFNTALKYCYAISCKDNFKKYLDIRGYKMHKMPVHEDGKKYTISDFIDTHGDTDKTYLILIRGHLTVVKQNVLYDTWNCSKKYMGNYWVI